MLAPTVSAVEEAVARALLLHPYGLTGTIIQSDRTTADAAALWKRLLALAPDEADGGLRALSEIELRLLTFTARARLNDMQCRAIIAALFRVCGHSGMEQLGWDLFLLTDGDPGFREAAQAFVSSRGPVAQGIAASRNPCEEIVERWLNQPMAYAEWLVTSGLAEIIAPQVQRQLIRLMLSKRLPAVCAKALPATLHEWSQSALTDEERLLWYPDYLESTYKPGWAPANPIVLLLVDRFDLPSMHEFWRSVSDPAAAAVREWVIDGDLTRLLQGERLKFWRRYVQRMTSRPVLSRSEEAVFIRFRNFFAVQYVNMGHATYMFPNNCFTSLKKLEHPRLYGGVLAANRNRESLGRYEHRGWDWESSAQHEVNSVLRATGS